MRLNWDQGQRPGFCLKYNVKTSKIFMINFMNLKDHVLLN